ncbi:putative F-box associated interaction domain-containing protein [Helianthus anomalus]
MADLPVHTIVFEILTRVPAKDVGRSKSVCKQCSIVTFPFHHQNNDVSILSHLNGLLCVCLNHTYELLLWNPTTTAFKHLSTPDSHGFYINNLDAIGLYVDADDDYKVLHIKRRSGVLGVYVYSREVDSWRNIPFITRQEYLSPHFNWSAGTFCGGTLYFTVCECWIGVQGDKLSTRSFYRNGSRCFSEWDYWIKVLSCPPIPPISLSLWCDITHYVTNGNWFVMTKLGKLFTIEMDMKPFECFYPVTWFRGFKGAVFVETIVSPSI